MFSCTLDFLNDHNFDFQFHVVLISPSNDLICDSKVRAIIGEPVMIRTDQIAHLGQGVKLNNPTSIFSSRTWRH